MKAGGVPIFLVIVGLVLSVPPAIASSDFFNILSIPSHNDSELTQATFAYFKFALTWPPSHCNGRNPACKVSPVPQDFTIHGLWPDNLSGPMPINCPGQYVPVAGQLSADLRKHWPDLQLANNNAGWRRQYLRHGTCALPTYTQSRYFTLARDLKLQYDVLKALADNTIIPGSTSNYYTVTQFTAAVRGLTTKTPLIGCNKDSSGNERLHEIYICFDPNGKVRDCPNRVTQNEKCSSTTARIYFPT